MSHSERSGTPLADNSILLGILAVQLSFCRREQILQAMKNWKSSAAMSFAEYLRQSQLMPDDVLELLQAVVQQHARHQLDSAQAISSEPYSSIASLRDELEFIAESHSAPLTLNAALQPDNQAASAQTFLLTGEAENDPNVTLARSSRTGFTTPRSSSRYQIVRPHAKGGLGEVFVAHDEELHREVALKEIQAQFADHLDCRNRFRLEAEVTGNLEHPGIVPVYGLGQYSDGRPYYAMRFIQGHSLREAIEHFHTHTNAAQAASPQQDTSALSSESAKSGAAGNSRDPQAAVSYAPDFASVEFRKLLGRFITVCQAISYAHSRGVLHRDLKPGNIVLGKFGETLVVDWGLAKVQGKDDQNLNSTERTLQPTSGSGVAPTMMGSAVGTPAYMPPEQAAGQPEKMSPASDVYSLGATLYHLLTGRPPFGSADVISVLNAVKAGRFPAPREVLPSVPKALEAICLKAMALDPLERYQNAQHLADDIENYLADEKVTAFQEPLIVRTRRWARKHQVTVTATAAAVLVSTVALALSSAMLSSKNGELTALNLRLDGKNNELTQANEREREARRSAEASELAAREQSQLALSTLNSVIRDIQGGLKDLPGGSEVRRRLLATSMEKLNSVSTQFLNQANVDRSTMLALIEMGELLMQFGTESQSPAPAKADDAQGPSAIRLAESCFRRALMIAETLSAQAQTSASAQADLSLALQNVGHVLLALNEFDESRKHYDRALSLRRDLVQRPDADSEASRALTLLLDDYSALLQTQGQTDEALRVLEELYSLRSKAADSAPDNSQSQLEFADACERLGSMLLAAGRTSEAHRYFTDNYVISERLANAAPDDFSQQRGLSIAVEKLGQLAAITGNSAEAVKHFQRSFDISQKCFDADPQDAMLQRDLMISAQILSSVLLEVNRTDEALRMQELSLQMAQSLADKDPQNMQRQREFAGACENLGDLLYRSKRMPEAIEQFERCRNIRKQQLDHAPDNLTHRRDYSVILGRLADALMATGKLNEAVANYELVAESMEKIVESDPVNASHRRDLVVALARLGSAYLELNRPTDALKRYQQRLQLNLNFAKEDPANVSNLSLLAESHESLGKTLRILGVPQDAIEQYQEGLTIRRRLADANPTNGRLSHDFVAAEEILADVFLAEQQVHNAVPLLEEALHRRQSLVEALPPDLMSQQKLRLACFRLAQAQLSSQEFDKAIEAFQKAIDFLQKAREAGIPIDQPEQEQSFLEAQIASARTTKKAIAPWEAVITLPAEELPAVLDRRGIVMLQQGRTDDAIQAAQALRELPTADERQLYSAACLLSRASSSLQTADSPTLTPDQQARQQQLLRDALTALQASLQKGWKDIDHLNKNPDLAPVRALPEFQAMKIETQQ
ncbi:MAG: tetratricopeptide repeat protein [Planctomycetaceae bacterium]